MVEICSLEYTIISDLEEEFSIVLFFYFSSENVDPKLPNIFFLLVNILNDTD